MNDPNGLFYDPVHELYHLMFQYRTPRVWGHAVSKDLVRWTQLPISLLNDAWYDEGGVYSGSATVLDDESRTPVLSYSVSTNDMQAIAWPKNRSDPYLTEWVKDPSNPIITSRSPNGTAPTGRDDTTAIKIRDTWIMVYGTTSGGSNGAAIVFQSKDFRNWTQLHELHSSDVTGMWECPDFFPIPNAAQVPNAKVTHLLKASTEGRDFWVTGTFNQTTIQFIPYDSSLDMGTGNQILDYGRFYASKSFYDPSTNRQILFGWVLEERDVDDQGGPYGWASTQSLPRSIELDDDGIRIKTPPIQELQSARVASSYVSLNPFDVQSGQLLPLSNVTGTQLELIMDLVFGDEPSGSCGLLVRAHPANQEFTNVSVQWSRNSDGQNTLTLVTDTTHGSTNYTGSNSLAPIVVPLQSADKVQLRVFADASVIEAYVNDGATVMTRRVYPILPNSDGVKVFALGGHCSIQNFESWQLAI